MVREIEVLDDKISHKTFQNNYIEAFNKTSREEKTDLIYSIFNGEKK